MRIKILSESREFSVKILISFCPFTARREHATRGTELNAANTVVSGSLGEKQQGTSVIPMFPDVSWIFFDAIQIFIIARRYGRCVRKTNLEK